MKLVKMLLVLICFTFMSTGCRHDHYDHEEKSTKKEKSGHSHKETEKKDENHRH